MVWITATGRGSREEAMAAAGRLLEAMPAITDDTRLRISVMAPGIWRVVEATVEAAGRPVVSRVRDVDGKER